jgi:DNA mismatch endonuclease (patch repair protein)
MSNKRARGVDIVDQQTRSRMMGRIRGKDTRPELAVRRIAHRLGYRFRLHRRDLAGSPDVVFPRRRKVIFVHGCYWHRHDACRYCYTPKSNIEFWNAKFERNKERDLAALSKLKEDGWDPLVIWECESADPEGVTALLTAHLGTP